MDMNFQHPLRTDLQVLDVSKKRSVRDNGSIDATLPRILKHGLAALLGGGAIYLVAATSVTPLDQAGSNDSAQ